MFMLDTIILVADSVEQPVLTSVLQRHNPLLTVRSVATLADVTALEPDVLSSARLVGFCTDTLVPRHVLDQLAFGAYNFHPGSPQFPGWSPARFAIHQRAKEFGGTAHVMIEKVDAGPIVAAEMFPVPPGCTVSHLEELAYACVARLFWQLAPSLATQPEPLAALSTKWSGEKCTRRRYAEMCDSSPEVSHRMLDRRVEGWWCGTSIDGHR
jgi:methionyl-tRNA formyltransferase